MTFSSAGSALVGLARAWTDGSALPNARAALMRWLGALFAAVFAIGAVGCISASVWIYALPLVGPVGAPLVVAGLLLVIGLAAFLAPRLGREPVVPPPPVPAITPELVLAEATHLLRDHKLPVLLGALLVGLSEGTKRR